MLDAVAGEHLRVTIVHACGDRHDQGALGHLGAVRSLCPCREYRNTVILLAGHDIGRGLMNSQACFFPPSPIFGRSLAARGHYGMLTGASPASSPSPKWHYARRSTDKSARLEVFHVTKIDMRSAQNTLPVAQHVQ